MDNRTLVEHVFQLQVIIRSKNPTLAGYMASVTVPLLEYKGTLALASEDELMRIPGLGRRSRIVTLLLRVFQGEDLESIAKDVPQQARTSLPARRPDYSGKERTEWSGSWDNAARVREGE